MRRVRGHRPKDAWLQSHEMIVSDFREILWLPLRYNVDLKLGQSSGATPDHWTLLEGDPLLAQDLGGASEADNAYKHYLLYHPFVRSFLFGEHASEDDQNEGDLSIWVLKDSVKHQFSHLDVVLSKAQKFIDLPERQDEPVQAKTQQLRFQVDRCRLYQLKCGDTHGVVMLELELRCLNADMHLSTVLDALDFLRRTHPAYFPMAGDQHKNDSSALHWAGGRYPLAAHWTSGNRPIDLQFTKGELQAGKTAFISTVTTGGSHSHLRKQGASPIAPHWQSLLGAHLTPDRVIQVEDERMPLLAYVATPDPSRISRGDWMRLCFCDYHDDSYNLPQAKQFLSDFEAEHCYDRFFDAECSYTRYMNSGYAMVMVGKGITITPGDNPSDPTKVKHSFFSGDGEVLFRRHYASLGLLAQLNKAALLVFSNRLKEAMRARGNPTTPQAPKAAAYRDSIKLIQADFLNFTYQHWFDGVSNQIQPTELYSLWLKHMGLREMFATVQAEVRGAHDFVLTEQEAIQTDQVDKLTRYGLWLAGAGLLLGAAGAGFPVDHPLTIWLGDGLSLLCLTDRTCFWSWQRFWTVVSPLSILVACLALWILSRVRRPEYTPKQKQPSRGTRANKR